MSGKGYWYAVLAVLAAFAIQLSLLHVLHVRLFLTFFPALLMVALHYGRRPGLFALGLSVVGWLVVMPLHFRSEPFSLADLATVLLFGLVGYWLLSLAEALRSAKRRGDEMLNSITDAFISVNAQDRYIFLNSEAEKALGKDVLGKSIWEAFPDIDPQVREHFQRCRREQIPVEFESYYAPWSTWFSNKLYPGANGEVSLFFRDITEQKTATDQLRRSEHQLNEMLDLVPAIVWTNRGQGGALYFNRAWHEYTGKSMEESNSIWTDVVHPDDVESLRKHWMQAMQSGAPLFHEHRLRRHDGQFRWFSARSVPLKNEQGDVLKWFGTALDTTDTREARESLRLLADAGLALSASLNYEATLDNLAHLVVPRLADWCAIDVKDEAGEMQRVAVVHQDPALVARSHEVVRLYPPDPNASSGRHHVARTGVTEWMAHISDDVLVAHAKDERHLAILRELNLHSYICVPLLARGHILGTLTLCHAESGRRYNEQDVRVAEELGRRAALAVDNARLHQAEERAGRLKDEFLATLSHELRTPLNAIMGWTHILKQDASAMEQGLEVIERNARVQSQIVEDLLDMSRIVAGKIHIDRQPIDFCEVLDEAVKSVQPVADAKEITMHKDREPAALHVFGDAARLQQVLWNLLSNAIKFTPKGGNVTIAAKPVGEQLQVVVTDDGQGISAEFLPFIFERFRQQDGSTTRRFGGLGLGLSIARQLIELHGGEIWAQSPGAGQGSTFTFRLPLRQPDPTVEPEEPERRGVEIADLRVLVVDDDRDTRELLVRVLREAKATVFLAASAAQALELLRECGPDLIVSDIGMPEMDGYQLIRELRELGYRLPAIACTAFARDEDRKKALAAGYDGYLSKPIVPSELIGTLAELKAAATRQLPEAGTVRAPSG